MPIRLADLPTRAPQDANKNETRAETERLAAHIAERQALLYAQKKHALLVVIQGMDASGKDSVARNVFSASNPVGIRAVSFKAPTEEERAHDFLWRVHRHAPERGYISLFIRSHYEDVVVQRVHGWVDEKRIKARSEAINAFEKLLVEDAGTTIIKCFLHSSKAQQEKELRERLEEPEKNWKHNAADWKERERWDEYQDAFQRALNACDAAAPWHVVPADNGWYRNCAVARIVADALDGLDLRYPLLTEKEKAPFLK